MGASMGGPGWYPDPQGSGRRRYFDGRNWGPFEPVVPQSPPPPVPGRQLSVNWSSQVPTDGYSSRSRVIAALLQFFLGFWGLGRFYLGYSSLGAIQLTLGLAGIFLTAFCFVGIVIVIPLAVWVTIESVMMLSGAIPDAEGRKLR